LTEGQKIGRRTLEQRWGGGEKELEEKKHGRQRDDDLGKEKPTHEKSIEKELGGSVDESRSSI